MANENKRRKSEIQERFDEADNAGRFAGGDQDAKAAKEEYLKAGAQDTTGYEFNSPPVQNSSRDGSETGDEGTDRDAHRNPSKSPDIKGEAQNINDDIGRPLSDDELEHARNKANSSKGTENSR